MRTPPEHLSEKGGRDYLLIQDALQNGNQKAYAQLMQHYRDPIYYMVLKMLKNPYDAEDLTIETFGKAFKNLENYNEQHAFSTWLFRIATNTCIDYLRKRNTSPQCIDHDLAETENSLDEMTNPYAQDTPEDLFMEKQKIMIMHQAVEQLRPRYRMLIEMRYYEELSYEEISQTLNISLSSVKVLLFRAKKMLLTIMEKIRYSI